MTQAPATQHKLRQEARTISNDSPTQEELASLPYLDAVARETLRLYAPVTTTVRVATHNDTLPVSKAYKDKSGNWQNEILCARRISPEYTLVLTSFSDQHREGKSCHHTYHGREPVPLALGRRCTPIHVCRMSSWAYLFCFIFVSRRPERWETPPEEISKIPGPWRQILTFGSGARGCIGFRFAVNE